MPGSVGLWTWGDGVLWDVKTWGGGDGVEIGGVKYTETYGLHISDVLTSQANEAEFGVLATWDANRPQYGQAVTIWINGAVVFSGRVVAVESMLLTSDSAARSTNTHRFAVRAYDYSLDLQKLLVAESYGSELGTTDTLYEIVKDIVDTYTLPADGFDYALYVPNPGPTIARVVFNYKNVFQCFDDLAKLAGMEWWVDYDRKIHFVSVGIAPDVTPFDLVDGATNFEALQLTPSDITQIRNRVYIRGGSYLSNAYAQTFIPPAGEDSLKLDYLPYTVDGLPNVGAIYVNGVLKTWGIEGIDEAATYDFIVSTSSGVVRCDLFNGGSFAGTETVIVGYYYKIPLIVAQSDYTSINLLKALGVGDGIFEYLITDDTITSLEYARARARQELAMYAYPQVSGSFVTFTAGFKAGQKLGIELTDRGYTAGAPSYYLVQEVEIDAMGGNQYKYTVHFATLQTGFNAFLVHLVDITREKKANENEVVDVLVGMSEEVEAADFDSTTATVKSPPFKWSNDAGTTPNKLIWNCGEWA